jgi:hypothetical protein
MSKTRAELHADVDAITRGASEKLGISKAEVAQILDDGIDNASLLARLSNGSSVAVSGIRQIPGMEVDAGEAQFWHGDQTDADVALTTNDSTAVLAQTFEGLEPSSFYRIKFGFEIVIWDLGATPNSGRLTGLVGVKIATDASSVATCTIAAAFYPDKELDTALAGATANLTATTGGLTMWATRPTGVACRCSCAWWVTEFKRLVTT